MAPDVREPQSNDGGYVFVPSHNIQADVTADRIHKVYETGLKYRHYSIAND